MSFDTLELGSPDTLELGSRDTPELNSRQRRAFLTLFTGLASTAILSACGATGLDQIVQSPKLSVDRVDLLNATSQSQSMRFLSRLANPNALALPIQSANLGLNFAGIDMGRLGLPQPVNVPAQGQAQTAFDVQTDLMKAINQLGGLRQIGMNSPIPFGMDGRVGVSSLNVNLPVNYQGNFTLANLGTSATRLLGPSLFGL